MTDPEAMSDEQALREREKHLELITDALPVLVAYVDVAQRYTFVSAAYERWFGRPRTAFIGRRIEDVLGAEGFAAIRPYVERALTGVTVTYEVELPFPDGARRNIEATYVPQRGEDGDVLGFVSLVADITERKGFERFRASAVARAERLLKITTAIADAVVAEEVFEALVDYVAEAVDASSAGLWLVSEDRRSAHLARGIGYAEDVKRYIATFPLDLADSMPILDCILRGEPLWLASQEALLTRYPHLRVTATVGRKYRIACLPLVAHGRTIGALGLTIEGTADHTDDERAFLVLVARYATQALQRLRLFERERTSRALADAAAARMGMLSRASRTFAQTGLDLRERLNVVAAELGAAMDSAVLVWLIEDDGRLHLASIHHPSPEAAAVVGSMARIRPLVVGEGLTGRIAESGTSVLVPELDADELAARAARSYTTVLKLYPMFALVGAPLRARGEIVGVMTATRTEQGKTYTIDDLELVEELADRAASAVDAARLQQANLDARARVEHLYRFARVVVSADRVEQVFDAALDAIEATLGTNRAAILTYGAETTMRFRAWRNLSDAYRNGVEGHSPWPRDAIEPEPVLVDDVEHAEAMETFRPLLRDAGIGAVAFFPLVTRGRLLGKFMVYFARPRAWASHELETATAIANHLASVISRFAAIAKLEETVQQNELLAGVLAHDLRTPLGAIMMATQLMVMEGGDARGGTTPLRRIVNSGQRMKRMIDELLDFTRARSGGGIPIVRRHTNLVELSAQAIAELELAHPEWRIRLEHDGDASGYWDPDRLLQVISNLVANAGLHGRRDDDGAHIVVRLEDGSTDEVSLCVINHGAIPETLIPHLFEPFRGTRGRAASDGLGLGLFIVREIVIAHGGRVTVSSSEGAGTVFRVVLPRA